MDKNPHESPYLFDLRAIAYRFGESACVLEGLNFQLEPGTSFAIIGPSGCGKSTLLRLMAGLLPPDQGTIRFHGVDIAKASRREMVHLRRRIGMTFQHGGLFDSMTCADNLRLPLREAWRAKGKNLAQRVDRALKEVRLYDVEDLMVHEISGGMQKRLGLARALILNPEVVLFDEPTAGLDPVTSRAIVDLILEVRARYKMTIITVTSDMARAYQIADKIGFLSNGKFELIGSVEEIQNTKLPNVYSFVRGLSVRGEGNDDRI